jgi:O-antigen ligase
MDELIFPARVEQGVEAAEEQVSKPHAKASRREEPLAFAFFGLVLFMVVYFGRPEDWIPGLQVVPLAKITGALVVLAVLFSAGSIRWRLPREIVCLILLVVQLWLTVPFSPVWRGGAFKVMLDFWKVLPLAIVIYAAVRTVKRLQTILFVQGACVGTIAIISIVKAHVVSGRLQGAISGIYGNPNDLALIIDMTLPLCLALALASRRVWSKSVWSGLMLAMTYAVVLTASRAGALAFAVAAIVCIWQLGVKGRRFYILFLVPAAALIFWLYAGSTLESRFEATNTDSTTNKEVAEAAGSAEQRKQLLIRSLEVTAEHPFFGVGPGNFVVISGNWHVTHDSYTQISAEGGIPALLLYVLILGCAIANLKNVRKYRKATERVRLFSMALEASLATYLVGSIFGSEAYQLFPYCLIASISALRFLVRKERTNSVGSPFGATAGSGDLISTTTPNSRRELWEPLNCR